MQCSHPCFHSTVKHFLFDPCCPLFAWYKKIAAVALSILLLGIPLLIHRQQQKMCEKIAAQFTIPDEIDDDVKLKIQEVFEQIHLNYCDLINENETDELTLSYLIEIINRESSRLNDRALNSEEKINLIVTHENQISQLMDLSWALAYLMCTNIEKNGRAEMDKVIQRLQALRDEVNRQREERGEPLENEKWEGDEEHYKNWLIMAQGNIYFEAYMFAVTTYHRIRIDIENPSLFYENETIQSDWRDKYNKIVALYEQTFDYEEMGKKKPREIFKSDESQDTFRVRTS